MRKLFSLLLAICSLNTFANPDPTVFDVRSFGAKGDGVTSSTTAIQKAMDACNAAGGGTVLVAGGNYLTGTLFFKSNVTLRVEAGAQILGSTKIADYATNTDRTMYKGEPYMDRCLFFVKDVENISLEGSGVIDGQGKKLPEPGDPVKHRPKMFRFMNSTHIRMRDITLRNPASWTTEFRYCTDIAVDGITISSRLNSNGDGLDFDGCKNVRVTNSAFNTGDDAICLQTSLPDKPCMDVVISNCNFSSRWAGVRIGLLSRGNIENVAINNCTFRDHNDSGLKIQLCEGAELKNMVFSNLAMRNVPRPVLVTFNSQNAWVDAHGDPPPMKRMANLVFKGITVENDSTLGKHCGFIVTGMEGHPVEGIVFSDIRAVFPGGGTEADSKTELAEYTQENLKGRWPEYGSLRGTLTASGFYLRHVKGLQLNNVEVITTAPDARPAIVAIDATGLRLNASPVPVERKK